MNKIIATILSLSLLAACNKTDDAVIRDIHHDPPKVEYGLTENFIQFYIDPKEIALSKSILDNTFRISYNSFVFSPDERYNELAIKNNDASFNSVKALYYDGTLSENLTQISIVSDKNVDGNHPAGTPLDDIITLEIHSMYDYISSNYSEKETHVMIKKTLSEITPQDMRLMCIGGFWGGWSIYPTFSLTKQPTQKGEHKLTVTFKTESGEIIVKTINISF